MPDLLGQEFIQIQEAIETAYELLCGPVHVENDLHALNAKLEKIRQARELMADLAAGNSR